MSTNTQFRTFNSYIYKVLKLTNENMGINSETRTTLESIMRIFAENLSNKSAQMAKFSNKQTIIYKDVKHAVNMLFPAELSSKFEKRADACIENFKNWEKKDAKKHSTEFKAGLVFSCSLVTKFLRQTHMKVSIMASIYLTCMLELLCGEIIDLSIKVAHTTRRARLTVNHVAIAIANNKDLAQLMENTHVYIISGHVAPSIDERLLEKIKNVKRNVRKDTKGGDDSKKRRNPGAKTMSDIKKEQKIVSNRLQKTPFVRLVRTLMNSVTESSTRFSEDVWDILQGYTEDKITELFYHSNKICLHSSRETLTSEDVKLYLDITNKRYSMTFDPQLSGLSEPGFRRLAQRAGVMRMANDVWLFAVRYIVSLLEDLLNNLKFMLVHQNRTIVSSKLLIETFNFNGEYITLCQNRPHSKKNGGKEVETDDTKQVDEPVEEGVVEE